MSANSKTWYTNPNFDLSDSSTATLTCKSMLWQVLALLVGYVAVDSHGLWTVYYSCDSSTAGTANDGVDRWGNGTFTASKLVRATAGSVHSWMVLKSPAGLGPLYMIIDWSTATDNLWNLTFCKTAPTGGTTTARPTSTDEWSHTASEAFVRNSALNHKCHISKTANGEFVFLANAVGIGRMTTCTMAHLTSTTAGRSDNYPQVTYHENDGGSLAALLCHAPAYSSNNDGGPNALTTTSSAWKSRLSDGSAVQPLVCAAYYFHQWKANATSFVPVVSSYTNSATGLVSAANPDDTKWDVLPAFLVSTNRVKGWVPDIGWISNSATEGALDNLSGGSPERIVVGDFSLPWTSTTSPNLA